MDARNDENEGLSSRRNLMGVKKNIDMIGYLHCDVFNQDKLLINGVEVRVRLVRSRDSFESLKLLSLYDVSDSPSIILAHEKALSKTTAKYPLTRVKVKGLQCIVVFMEKHWIMSF